STPTRMVRALGVRLARSAIPNVLPDHGTLPPVMATGVTVGSASGAASVQDGHWARSMYPSAHASPSETKQVLFAQRRFTCRPPQAERLAPGGRWHVPGPGGSR